MKRIRRWAPLLGGLLLLAAVGPGPVEAEGRQVDVKLALEAPRTSQALRLELTLFRIRWDNDRGRNVPDRALFSRELNFDPDLPDQNLSTSFTLDSGETYQFVVAGYDARGNPWLDATYYYAPSMFGDTNEVQVKLSPGEINTIPVRLAKRDRTGDRGNFVDVYTASDGDYLALYDQADQVWGILYGE